MCVRNFTRPILAALAACLSIASAQVGWAQDASTAADTQSRTDVTTITTTARAVLLDVVVTADGKPVNGLTRDDFVILEDDVPQTISTFETPAGMGSGTKTPIQNIILFDEMNTPFTEQAQARLQLIRMLRKQGPQLPNPTSLMLLTNDGLAIVHQSTRDTQALIAAVGQVRPLLPSKLLLGGTDRDTERIQRSMNALYQIASARAGTDIRKNIIWISSGFPALLLEHVPDTVQDGFLQAIREISGELLKARATVYTIDPQGVRAISSGARVPLGAPRATMAPQGAQPVPTFGQMIEMQTAHRSLNFADIAMQRFAEETGGRALRGRNDIDGQITQTIEEATHYYTLSYYPQNHNFDSKFRTITVKVSHPGATARTRAGYFASPALLQPSDDDLKREFAVAVASPLSYNGLSLRQLPNEAGQPSSGKLTLTLDPRELTWRPEPDGNLRCELTAAAAGLTSGGKSSQFRFYKFEASRPTPNEGGEKKAATIVVDMPAGANISRVRVVVRDVESGRMGSADLPAQAASSAASVSSRPKSH